MTGLRKLTVVELKLLLRNPSWLFTIGIPLFSLLIFGLPIRNGGGTGTDLSGLTATAVTTSLALVGLYMVPVTLVTYRDKGILRRFSTTPLNPVTLLIVQLVLHLGLIAVSTGFLIAVARIVLDVSLPPEFLGFTAAFLLAACAMFAIGLVIASVAPSAPAANGIGVLLFFPMAFLAGLMVPPAMMSPMLLEIGNLTPLGAFRHAVEHVWMGEFPPVEPLRVMAAFAIAAGLIAVKAFRWD